MEPNALFLMENSTMFLPPVVVSVEKFITSPKPATGFQAQSPGPLPLL